MNKKDFFFPSQWEHGPAQFFDAPQPDITFEGNTYVLTGYFAFGDRDIVEGRIVQLGAKVSQKPTQSGCTVVIGTLPSSGWLTSDAGKKILKALKMRDEGYFVSLISEDHFVNALNHAELRHGNQQAIPFYPEPVSWEKHVKHWFESLRSEFPIDLTASKRAKGLLVHVAGKERLWVMRIHSLCVSSTIKIEVKGCQNQWVSFKRTLPEDSLMSVKVVLGGIVESIKNMNDKESKTRKVIIKDNAPLKKVRLTPEELQRLNTARKAAMRAKPATEDVLKAAKLVIDALNSEVPSGTVLEGQDRAKYYAVAVLGGPWLCRLYYKTKNKYIEIAGDKQQALTKFEEVGTYLPILRSKLGDLLGKK